MDFNVLTSTLSNFVTALNSGQGQVARTAGGVLRGLAIIEIVVAALWLALDHGSLASLFKKLFRLSVWCWFASEFTSLAKTFTDGLVRYGLSAGGMSGDFSLLLNPSRIAGMALESTAPLAQQLHDAGITQLSSIFTLGFAYIVLVVCFFIIACQVCLAVVEYYLVLTLATCLIPFGISEHTKFLSEKAIGAVVAVSVKLMVLAFIMAIVSPVLGSLRFSGAGGELKLNEILSMVLVAGMLAFTVWRAPGFASDLLAASPSLGVAGVGQQVTSVVSSGANAASGAVAAGLAATRAASGLATGGGTTALGALKMVGSAVLAGARGQGQVPAGGGGAVPAGPGSSTPNSSTPNASSGASAPNGGAKPSSPAGGSKAPRPTGTPV
jgi:type IV secretion system protein TrbL